MSALLMEKDPAEIAAWSEDRSILLEMERRKSRLFRLWIATGLVFMTLPGTILGFTNLLLISAHRGFAGLSPAWIQAHGHAQVFGWIGSFALGIGFYSQPLTPANRGRLPVVCWALWAAGLTLHWLAQAYFWFWRISLPLSGFLELAAILLFLYAASHHKQAKSPQVQGTPGSRPRIEAWMQSVLLSNAAMFVLIAINFGLGVRLALKGNDPARSHDFDQRYLVLLAWGFLAPLVWGFSARCLSTFLGVRPVRDRFLQVALVLDVVGIILGLAGMVLTTTLLLAAAALLAAFAIGAFSVAKQPANSTGIHPSFPFFIRTAYVWSVLASLLGVWAALSDVHGGIWGGSRHALTVGFAALMVMTVGPRILPRFAGVSGIWSQRLMVAALLLLLAGCTLRVSMEPLAYEGWWSAAWKILPCSGCLELSAVLLFALQLILTFTRKPSIFV